jgi:hypothetical protein
MKFESGSLSSGVFTNDSSAITSSNKRFDENADADYSGCLFIFFLVEQSNALPQNAANFFMRLQMYL